MRMSDEGFRLDRPGKFECDFELDRVAIGLVRTALHRRNECGTSVERGPTPTHCILERLDRGVCNATGEHATAVNQDAYRAAARNTVIVFRRSHVKSDNTSYSTSNAARVYVEHPGLPCDRHLAALRLLVAPVRQLRPSLHHPRTSPLDRRSTRVTHHRRHR